METEVVLRLIGILLGGQLVYVARPDEHPRALRPPTC